MTHWSVRRKCISRLYILLVVAWGMSSTIRWPAANMSDGFHDSSSSEQRPDFTGVWQLQSTENQQSFMLALGYNRIFARAAYLTSVTQVIETHGDSLVFTIHVVPRIPSSVRHMFDRIGARVGVYFAAKRRTIVKPGEERIHMNDDAGRKMLLSNPHYVGAVFRGRLKYLDQGHELTIDRFLDDGRMVEHLRYPSKGLEMRRIFAKVTETIP
eukprot:TRINITY_DN29895_c0_g1_i1.p1 TRINITY_DN29895_c0_g1~~TRINITY_DN29895_c0_g1_i1.p1  ORF type:complete len:212 (+),score=21.59 TRINITY_DN29895_c0_g1_i1:104-739(+)